MSITYKMLYLIALASTLCAAAADEIVPWPLVRKVLNHCARPEARLDDKFGFAATAEKCAWAVDNVRARLDAGDGSSVQPVCHWLKMSQLWPSRSAWMSSQPWHSAAKEKCEGYPTPAAGTRWISSGLQALASSIREKGKTTLGLSSPPSADEVRQHVGYGLRKVAHGLHNLKHAVSTDNAKAWRADRKCSMMRRLQRMGLAGKKVAKLLEHCTDVAADSTPEAGDDTTVVGAAKAFHKFFKEMRRTASDAAEAVFGSDGDSSVPSETELQSLSSNQLKVKCDKIKRLEEVLMSDVEDIYQRRPWLAPLKKRCAEMMAGKSDDGKASVASGISPDAPLDYLRAAQGAVRGAVSDAHSEADLQRSPSKIGGSMAAGASIAKQMSNSININI